jgi:hypothetical protein
VLAAASTDRFISERRSPRRTSLQPTTKTPISLVRRSIIAAESGGALVLVTPGNCNACYAGRPICKSASDSENWAIAVASCRPACATKIVFYS